MEWISVKEQLPSKENKWIVALIKRQPIIGLVHSATITLSEEFSFYWPERKWLIPPYYGDVTHWMPLPESPK